MKKIRDSVARDQLMLLPPSIEDFVSNDDSVRVINKILDDMHYHPITYRNGLFFAISRTDLGIL